MGNITGYIHIGIKNVEWTRKCRSSVEISDNSFLEVTVSVER